MKISPLSLAPLIVLLASCAVPEHGESTVVDEGANVVPRGTDVDAALVAALLERTSRCAAESNGQYKTDEETAPTVDICSLEGALFWRADMDIDCDGERTSACSESTDPWYQPDTSAHDSRDRPLDASQLPYVVIPLPSSRFRYADNGIALGQVVAVIHDGHLQFGVFGDEGPNEIIGEASYAMANALGIDSNPASGGVDGDVTYIVFTGDDAVANTIEDQDEAATIGARRAQQLLEENSTAP